MPKFSIIIPVYNVAPYLRECLDSVLAQTFTDWEAICVDDGSTDGSGAILDEYREKVEKLGGGGRRMVVIHQANAGVSAARNAALDVAQGEWICFVDADDVIDGDWLRALCKGCSAADVDWVQMQAIWWHLREEMPKTGKNVGEARCRVGETKEFKWDLIGETTLPFCNFFRRSVVCSCRFDERIHLCEDGIFVESVVARVGKCCAVDYDGYYYRMRETSAVHSRHPVDQPLFYLAETKRLISEQLSPEEMRDSSSALTYRIEKDIRLQLKCLRDDVTRRETCEITRAMRELRRMGAFRVRAVREKKASMKWWLFLHLSDRNILLTRPGLLGMLKLIPYFLSRDVRWLTDGVNQFKRLVGFGH